MIDMPLAIEKELKRLDAFRDEALILTDIARMAHEVAAMFESVVRDVSITRWTAERPFVNITADITNFKEIVPVLTELAKRGWHTDKKNPYSDFIEINRRTYNLLRDHDVYEEVDPLTGERREHSLRVMCFLKEEGATCRKVLVGEKREPVYEFVCN